MKWPGWLSKSADRLHLKGLLDVYLSPLDPKLTEDRRKLANMTELLVMDVMADKTPAFEDVAIVQALLTRIRLYLQVWFSLNPEGRADQRLAARDMLGGLNAERISLTAMSWMLLSEPAEAPQEWKLMMRRRGFSAMPWREAISILESPRYNIDARWILRGEADAHLLRAGAGRDVSALLASLRDRRRSDRDQAALLLSDWLSGLTEGLGQRFRIQVKRAEALDFNAAQIDARPETIEIALEVAKERAPVLATKWFAARCEEQGVDQAIWHDRFGLSARGDGFRNPKEALAEVVAAVGGIHPDVAKMVRQIIASGQVKMPNGRGGGFTTPVLYDLKGRPEIGPLVYSPFNGGEIGLTTLAHEIGHAAHACMSLEKGSALGDAGWALSEMIAFTAESLVASDVHALSMQDVMMLVIQPAIGLFERELAAATEFVSIDDLWLASMKVMHGPTVSLESYAPFWRRQTASISSTGYCMAYVLGWSLSQVSLSQLDTLGEELQATYLSIMKAGSTIGFEQAAAALGFENVRRMVNLAYDMAENRVAAWERA